MKSFKIVHHPGNDADNHSTVGEQIEGLRAGTLIADGGIATAKLANDAVTYAKMQNVSATSRIIGRKTAGAGDPEELTLSEALDFIGSAAQGDILYRGASAWARLGAGNAGQLLRSGGAAANPSWVGGLPLLASGTMSSQATLDLVLTAYTGYGGLLIKLVAVPATDDVILYCRFSTDGGSTYIATAYNYAVLNVTDAPVAGGTGNGNTTQINLGVTGAGLQVGNGATEGWHGSIELLSQTSSAFWPRINYSGYYISAAATPAGSYVTGGGAQETAVDVDAMRFLFSSGDIASGSYRIYGLG